MESLSRGMESRSYNEEMGLRVGETRVEKVGDSSWNEAVDTAAAIEQCTEADCPSRSTRLDSHALAATLRQVRYSIITLYLFCAVQFSRAAQRIVYKKRKICDFRVRL